MKYTLMVLALIILPVLAAYLASKGEQQIAEFSKAWQNFTSEVKKSIFGDK